MALQLIKTLEKIGKIGLTRILAGVLPGKPAVPPQTFIPRRVLIFRLDKRIGNGLLLLPLIKAIQQTDPKVTIDVLINPPVAELMNRLASNLIHWAMPYDQAYLFRNPFRWLQLLRRLQRNRYDLVISSSNPDGFSLSQALFARLISHGYTVGFRWKESHRFYHITIASSSSKHYADAQVDLWRWYKPQAPFELGGLSINPREVQQLYAQLPEQYRGEVLFWLGATGDKMLPESAITFIYETLLKAGFERVVLMAGSEDSTRMRQYSSKIQEQIQYWKRPLVDTALFFSRFRLFISADTGPMHLAVAVGVPTLTLFTTTNLKQYGYQENQKHVSLYWQNTPEMRTHLEAIIIQFYRAHVQPLTP